MLTLLGHPLGHLVIARTSVFTTQSCPSSTQSSFIHRDSTSARQEILLNKNEWETALMEKSCRQKNCRCICSPGRIAKDCGHFWCRVRKRQRHRRHMGCSSYTISRRMYVVVAVVAFFSETEIMSWSVSRWSQWVVKDSCGKVQVRRLWILPLLCDTNWRPHNARWHRVAWAAGSVVFPKMDATNHPTKFIMFPQRCGHRPYHYWRSSGQR